MEVLVWKIKQSSVSIVAKNLFGQLANKNSMHKKVSQMNQKDAKNVQKQEDKKETIFKEMKMNN